jgi:hypothetical protein
MSNPLPASGLACYRQLPTIYLPRMWVNKPRRTISPESLINLGQQIAQYVSCQEILKESTI